MADMPKPTDPKAPIQPPKAATPAAAAPAKSGSAIGKLFKLGLCAVTLFVAGSMYWHGLGMGEDRAKANPGTAAKVVWPWEWSKSDWGNWATFTRDTVAAGTEAAKAKIQAARDEWKKRQAAQAAAQPVATPVTDPAKPADPTKPVEPAKPAAATGLPEGWNDAATLVNEGNELWDKHDYAKAKEKLTAAKAKLEPMAAKAPVHDDVTAALKLVNDLLDDISMR